MGLFTRKPKDLSKGLQEVLWDFVKKYPVNNIKELTTHKHLDRYYVFVSDHNDTYQYSTTAHQDAHLIAVYFIDQIKITAGQTKT